MAYDEYLAERIERFLNQEGYDFIAKKMMGGLCFMVNDKMLCGPVFHKKIDEHMLMVRIGEERVEKNKEKEGCLPMDFTGRPMKGYLFIRLTALDRDNDLEFWMKECLSFNRELTQG